MIFLILVLKTTVLNTAAQKYFLLNTLKEPTNKQLAPLFEVHNFSLLLLLFSSLFFILSPLLSLFSCFFLFFFPLFFSFTFLCLLYFHFVTKPQNKLFVTIAWKPCPFSMRGQGFTLHILNVTNNFR